MSSEYIQLFQPHFEIDNCLAEIRTCLEKGWTGIGFKTNDFENQFSEYINQKYCHFINSNTNGIHLLLEVLKITKNWKEDDEIISTALTFVSTNHSILHAKMKPVFAEVDDSLCLTAENIAKKITSKTRAVVFVSIGGNSGEIEKIAKLCKNHGLVFILDAAHSAGSRLSGKHLSDYADYSIFSFQAVKNLPSADSGLITLKTEEEDSLARKLSWCGISKDTFSRSKDGYKWLYSVDYLGYKYNGNSIMGAIAIAQLPALDSGNLRRVEIASNYQKNLLGIVGLTFISHANSNESSRHLVQLILPTEQLRNNLIHYLDENKVGSGVHYRSNTFYPMYSSNQTPFTDDISKRIISLPVHLKLSNSDINRICDLIVKFPISN